MTSTINYESIYVNDISGLLGMGIGPNNQINLPGATDKIEYKIRNIHASAAITLIPAGPETIDLGLTTHPYVTSANVITLAPSQGVHIQGTNDSIPPMQVGWMITGIA